MEEKKKVTVIEKKNTDNKIKKGAKGGAAAAGGPRDMLEEIGLQVKDLLKNMIASAETEEELDVLEKVVNEMLAAATTEKEGEGEYLEERDEVGLARLNALEEGAAAPVHLRGEFRPSSGETTGISVPVTPVGRVEACVDEDGTPGLMAESKESEGKKKCAGSGRKSGEYLKGYNDGFEDGRRRGIEAGKKFAEDKGKVFDKNGNYRFPTDVTLDEPNTATAVDPGMIPSVIADEVKRIVTLEEKLMGIAGRYPGVKIDVKRDEETGAVTMITVLGDQRVNLSRKQIDDLYKEVDDVITECGLKEIGDSDGDDAGSGYLKSEKQTSRDAAAAAERERREKSYEPDGTEDANGYKKHYEIIEECSNELDLLGEILAELFGWDD